MPWRGDSKAVEGLEVSYYRYKSVNRETEDIYGTRTESGGSSITLELSLCRR